MRRWSIAVGCLLASFLLWASACESDGVTPSCLPDGGDCLEKPGLTPPMVPDAGAD